MTRPPLSGCSSERAKRIGAGGLVAVLLLTGCATGGPRTADRPPRSFQADYPTGASRDGAPQMATWRPRAVSQDVSDLLQRLGKAGRRECEERARVKAEALEVSGSGSGETAEILLLGPLYLGPMFILVGPWLLGETAAKGFDRENLVRQAVYERAVRGCVAEKTSPTAPE